MSEDTQQCSVCGAELEGSDVYEGLCHKCREARVLGRPASARKPPRPAPPPLAKPSPAPPPLAKPGPAGRPAAKPAVPDPGVIALETEVDTDADTREMLVLKESAAARTAPAAPAPSRGDAASMDFIELDRPAGKTARPAESPAPPAPEPTPGTTAPPAAPDEGGMAEVELLPPSQPQAAAEPTLDSPAAPSEAQIPEAELLPPSQPQAAPEAPALRLRREAPHSEFESAEATAPLPSPPAAGLFDRAISGLAARQDSGPTPAGRAAPKAAEPLAVGPRRAERPPELAPAEPSPLQLREEHAADSSELRALIERLSRDVEEISARLRGSAGLTMTSRQQVGFGFRAFFGFLMGAGLFALAAVGIAALAGVLFYPPALTFLRNLLSSILGTP